MVKHLFVKAFFLWSPPIPNFFFLGIEVTEAWSWLVMRLWMGRIIPSLLHTPLCHVGGQLHFFTVAWGRGSYNVYRKKSYKIFFVCVDSEEIPVSTINMGTKIYNNLPGFIKEIEKYEAFKRELQKFLLFHTFYSVEEFLNQWS